MKLTVVLPYAAVLGSTAASKDAYLWTVDTGNIVQRNNNQVSSISSAAVEQILIRRRGLSDSENIKIDDATLLEDLSNYGGWQRPLLADASAENPAKVFIRISGYERAVSELNILPDLWIEEPEMRLRKTFESKGDVKSICEYDLKVRSKADASVKYTYYTPTGTCQTLQEIEMLPSVMAVMATLPAAENLVGKGIATFHRTLLHLAATGNLESTLLVLPGDAALKPAPKSELKKRVERPLDLPFEESVSDVRAFKSNSSKTPALLKSVPKYFTSKSACQNQTNSCSGHGACIKAHGDQYTCSCSSTVLNDDGSGSKKTISWGGNACQKKDISFQFILFAAVGIFFTAMVAGGIGMLFNMGSEELPSVIGAGVVGPRAQR